MYGRRRHDTIWGAPVIAALCLYALFIAWREAIGYWSVPPPQVHLPSQAELSHNAAAWAGDVAGRLLWSLGTILYLMCVVIALTSSLSILRQASDHRRRWYLGISVLVSIMLFAYVRFEPAVVDPDGSMQTQLLKQLPPSGVRRSWSLAETPIALEAIGILYCTVLVASAASCLQRAATVIPSLAQPDSTAAVVAASELRRADARALILLTGAAATLAAGTLQSYATFFWPAALLDGDSLLAEPMRQFARSIAAHLGGFYTIMLAAIFGAVHIVWFQLAERLARTVTGSNDPAIVRAWMRQQHLTSGTWENTRKIVSVAAPALAALSVEAIVGAVAGVSMPS
jgi:hypothetical protein